MTKIKSATPIIFLTILFGLIFFYRLDYNTLASWDEAWYGSIAREMARSGDFIRMMWNGKPYFDHPPMGFWLMAISYKLFGINEFSTRFPSTLLGLLSILLIYKTAIELYGKKVIGVAAALIMGTSVWYVIRVRSGNLDSIFILFNILTVFLSVKSANNFKFFPLVMLALAGLVLTKTLVGVSAVILIIWLNFGQLLKLKKNFLYLLLGLLLFFSAIAPWYDFHLKTYSGFWQHHIFNIGTRNKSLETYLHPMVEKPLFYLHMGVRKWYYIWIASLGFIFITFKFIKKNIFFLILWNFVILYPFLTAKETELWHLIPVYLPLSFIVAVGMYEGALLANHILIRIISRHSGKRSGTGRYPRVHPDLNNDSGVAVPLLPGMTHFLYLLFFLYISFIQIKIFYPEVFPANKWIPDDVAISQAAAKYDKPIFLDDDYLPIAVFYSGQSVQPLAYLSDDKKTLEKFMQSDMKNFVVITRNWVVDDLESKNIAYKLLEKNNSFSILTNP